MEYEAVGNACRRLAPNDLLQTGHVELITGNPGTTAFEAPKCRRGNTTAYKTQDAKAPVGHGGGG
jgi:hypothetical protein